MEEKQDAAEAQGGQGAEEQQEPDYKALYEQAEANSRKWEKQAKANKDAADELEKSQEAAKTAEDQIADLTKRLDDKEKAEARVDADLLVGDTEEEMGAWADKLLAAFKQKPAAKVDKPGGFAKDGKGGSEMLSFARQLLGND